MKSTLKRELLTPTRFVYPPCTERFRPLFKVKQPTSIWYCDAPFSLNPRLDKLTISEINAIISTQRKLNFNFYEGFCVPTSIEERPLKFSFDYREAIDKLFLGNMGELGTGLFVREDLEAGTTLGFLGGKVITQDYKDSCDQSGKYSCLSYSSIFTKLQGRQVETFTYTSEAISGMLGFAQSATIDKIPGIECEHVTQNIVPTDRIIGNYAVLDFTLLRNTRAGTPLVWDYGKKFWQRHKNDGGDSPQVLSLTGEPLGTKKQVRKRSKVCTTDQRTSTLSQKNYEYHSNSCVKHF